MTLMALHDDAWGIADPILVIGYAVAGVVTLAASLAWRRSMAQGHAPTRELETDDLAYLADGERRVVIAAITRLRAADTVEIADGRLTRTGNARLTNLEDLDRAILVSLGDTGIAYADELLLRHRVRRDIDAIRARLVTEGLVPGPGSRSKWRRTALPLWTLVVLGLVWLTAILEATERPANHLVAALLAVFFVALLLTHHYRPATRAAEAALAGARDRHRGLGPGASPEQATCDPATTALGAALFGDGVLKRIEPAYGTTFHFDDPGRSRRRWRGRDRRNVDDAVRRHERGSLPALPTEPQETEGHPA